MKIVYDISLQSNQINRYAEYLTTRIFSQFESDYTDPIIDDAWICAKLEQAGVDLVQVNHLLWEKPNTFLPSLLLQDEDRRLGAEQFPDF